MKDMEIYNWLFNLVPENKEQEIKLHRMMRVILEKDNVPNVTVSENIEKFLNTLNISDILGERTITVYESYTEWCKQQKIKPEYKNIFSMAIQEKFNVKSNVTRVNGKPVRVFK